MLPIPLIISLVSNRAFKPNGRSFDIDFRVVAEKFPLWLEEIVLASLNELEQQAYLEGLMMYKILPTGELLWSATPKLKKLW